MSFGATPRGEREPQFLVQRSLEEKKKNSCEVLELHPRVKLFYPPFPGSYYTPTDSSYTRWIQGETVVLFLFSFRCCCCWMEAWESSKVLTQHKPPPVFLSG